MDFTLTQRNATHSIATVRRTRYVFKCLSRMMHNGNCASEAGSYSARKIDDINLSLCARCRADGDHNLARAANIQIPAAGFAQLVNRMSSGASREFRPDAICANVVAEIRVVVETGETWSTVNLLFFFVCLTYYCLCWCDINLDDDMNSNRLIVNLRLWYVISWLWYVILCLWCEQIENWIREIGMCYDLFNVIK